MNTANTILAVFAVLVSLWAWGSARKTRELAANVLRLLNARVGKLVDEAEGHKPQAPQAREDRGFPQPLPFPPAPQPVEEAASTGNGGEPPAAQRPGRAAPSPRPPHGGGKQGPSQQTRDLAAKAKAILARRGDVAPVELRDELGLTIKGFAKVRALLNADPDVVVYGQTKLRRYKLRDGAPTAARRQQIKAEADVDGRSPKLPSSPGAKSDVRQQPSLDDKVMSAIQLLPKSSKDLATELGVPNVEVLAALSRLKAEGDVRRHDSGNWVAVP